MAGILFAQLIDSTTPRAESGGSRRETNELTVSAGVRTNMPDGIKDSSGFPPPPSGQDSPRVAIVIDDLGWQKETAHYYDDINQPLTMAILPSRPYSEELYHRWKDKFEYIIHMPMEPRGYPEDDPGRSALMTGMTDETIRETLSGVLERYPKVRGINNHMGSKFTSTPASMRSVMDVLDRRRMYYLDSKTSARSVAFSIGRSKGVPVLSNDVFLDHTSRTYEGVRQQFEELIRVARAEGRAVGIGHFQSEATARVLRDLMPQYERRGVEFVTLGMIVRGTSPAP